MITFKCRHISALDKIASEILTLGKKYKVWTFEGQMGSGKTTLIQYICKHMGILDTVNSPTFSIINEYNLSSDEMIYHFDFFRITSAHEAIAIGCEEYFFSKNYCFIEWASKVTSLLPNGLFKIHIHFINEKSRRIEVQY